MRFSRATLRAGLSLAATLPLLAGALALGIPRPGADKGSGGRHTLRGTKPLWATARADQGSTADTGKVTARVYLAGRDAPGLTTYAKEVSDPQLAAYGSI